MPYAFTSNFAGRIQEFIQQKNALGFPYDESERLLWHFDKMCCDQFPAESQLTKEICLTWAIRKKSEGNNAFRNRLMPVREFARYLNRIGETAYVLHPNFARKGPRHIPHIYSEAEVAAIWRAADAIKPKRNFPIRHLVIPTFLRLLYCCGLRPGELRKLRVENVDLLRGMLKIVESKGHKDRLVWLADDVADLCRRYNTQVDHILPGRELFFPDSEGNLYTKQWIQKTFRILRGKADIIQAGEHPARLYDFRHTFATHRLYQWMRDGKDVSSMLPYLSAYMGHEQLSDTYYYIHLVPGLLESMMGNSYTAFAELLPEVGDDE
jgi:integrase